MTEQQPAEKTPHPFDQYAFMWMMAIFLGYYGITTLFQATSDQISYSDFKLAVTENRVESVIFRGDQIRGVYRGEGAGRFMTVQPTPPDESLLSTLESRAVQITVESSTQPAWLRILLTLIPWAFIVLFFLYFTRVFQQRMGGGKEGVFGFSKSKARLFEAKENDIGYDQVAGADSAKQELQEIIDFLRTPENFQKLGAKMPRGILLMGPPGTGKTMLAKATAHEAGVPFFSISASEFVEMFVGVGASRVRDMFQEARKKAPALIFIDEIDSVGRVRGAGLGGGNDEREQTLNQVLAEMDGFTAGEVVVVLAATNRPDVLDPALLRPGRFDRKITLELPQHSARQEILKVHMRNVPMQNDINIAELASMTVGFSGADLANLVNEAALLAARDKADVVTREHFHKAHDRVLMGSERKDLLNPAERKRTAIHESGHATVALFLPHSDPIRQITIIPRGRALGMTEQLPLEDQHNYSEDYLQTRLAVLMGGRCAERMLCGNISSGAANDLEQASHMAKVMVTQWGMSDLVGPVHFRIGSEHPFLGYELTQERDFSEDTARKIDTEVRRIVSEAEQLAATTLEEHRPILLKLLDALLERETLDHATLETLVNDAVDNQLPVKIAEQP
ncbi:MAG: ATP-dependent zinc metalloprotease FtsH [Gammaproteobacteria bacterium]|nr:ATP-dependent zinc metalloprotease FtsH [Gammaproteobacteria bacterium]MDP2140559.1 ATP-dependent zinc metalloprotease FtsH [Gammaproteobacteria bacterium]MDP2347328.1 ATP-dependent zinc metalloprotease FtsH [Gammaproteobacteria bacterium]